MALRLAVACLAMTVLMPCGEAAAVKHRAAERAIVDAVNEARQRHGLRPLRHSRPLARSAGRVARRVMRQGSLHHSSAPAGSRAWGEALAAHRGWRGRTRRTVRRWLRSPAHRPVLLGRFRRVGAGMKRGRMGDRSATVWVLHAGGAT